jgi:hypothetical protein
MNPFVPQFEGELELARVPDDFVARIKHRVEEGLLIPGSRSRADYQVRYDGPDAIRFGAEGFLTAYNIGLNEVSVERAGPNTLRYRVSFWRWTLAAVSHGAILGLVFLMCYALLPSVQRDIHVYRQGPAFFWGISTFFCLAWPWIMTAIHRKAAEAVLRRILTETLTPPADERAA